jgi:chromosome segregation ATPase
MTAAAARTGLLRAEIERLKTELQRVEREREDWKHAARLHLETVGNRQGVVERLRRTIESLTKCTQLCEHCRHEGNEALLAKGPAK